MKKPDNKEIARREFDEKMEALLQKDLKNTGRTPLSACKECGSHYPSFCDKETNGVCPDCFREINFGIPNRFKQKSRKHIKKIGDRGNACF